MQVTRLRHFVTLWSKHPSLTNSTSFLASSTHLSRVLTQVRLFRHKPEDIARSAGKPQTTPIEPPKNIPESGKATITHQPLVKVNKLKTLAAQYGPTAFAVFICVSLSSLTICFIFVKLGFASFIVKSPTFIEFAVKYQYVEAASEFVVAYVLHKFLAPVRYGLTGILTPVVVKALRNRGWLSKPK